MKEVIINADDLGLTSGINLGILQACKKGIVTSASLMVERPAAFHGVKIFKDNKKISLGLHFEIEKKDARYLEKNKKDDRTKEIIKRSKDQFYDQFHHFTRIVGRKPDHIDGHHHAHILPGLKSFFKDFSKTSKIPIRNSVNFIDLFFGQHSKELPSEEKLIKILRELPEGISEIMFHPGIVSPDLESSYKKERELELRALVSPKVKREIEKLNIQLINWKQVPVA